MPPIRAAHARQRHNPSRLPCSKCPREFKNQSGLTQHFNSLHAVYAESTRMTPDDPEEPEFIDMLHFEADAARDHSRTRVEIHPLINGAFSLFIQLYFRLLIFSGRRCDIDGDFIDPESPPPPRGAASPYDWTPYQSRTEFETAELLFKRAEMSGKDITLLMDLWAASLVCHGDTPPFANQDDMYSTIDSTPLGGVPWQTLSCQYNGPRPAEDVPPWMNATYEVCFRDAREAVRNMLANPDFSEEFDAAPYREFEGDERQYTNVMSGNWAWKQAVRIGGYLCLLFTETFTEYNRRGPLHSWCNVCTGHMR